jgi:hypothetical protein
MNPAVVAFLLAVASAVPAVNAANAPVVAHSPEPAFRVKINVSALDQVKGQIEHYVTEGLRSLGNVQLVEDNPRWTIEIVTANLQDDEGRLHGLGISFVVLEHGPQMQMLATLAQAWRYVITAGMIQDKFIEQGMKKLVSRVDSLPKGSDLTVFSQHRMTVVSIDKLAEACRDIVVDFDTKFLEPQSQARSGVADGLTNPTALAGR